jgi:uncharacterized protein
VTYKRWITDVVQSSLKERRATILVGPRQSGKTTLVRKLLLENSDYRTLDDVTLLAAAQADPHAFVKRSGKLMIIDEVQRAPDLLLAIKKEVDENSEKGQYLLTGSANIRQLPTVKESLAGRVAKLQLRPLAQGEILGKKPNFLQQAIAQQFVDPHEHYDRDCVITLALRGGFPEPLTLSEKTGVGWHTDYLEALIDHDLKEIINIRRRDDMHRLLDVLATWSSQYIDLSAIQSALAIKRQTLESYLNALEALFLFERLPAYAKTDYARIGKRPKLYMNDSGMMAALLKWNKDKVRLDNSRLGKLVETLVYNEIATQVSCYSGYQLYHYRDREQREIDLIVESDQGELLGIEVKAGSSVKKEHFKHLSWFQDSLVKKGQSFVGIVLYTGERVVSFGNNQWAVPMGCLWAD